MKYVSVLHIKDNTENRKCCSELIKVSKMPGVNQQKNRELKRAAPDLFKKSRPDQQSSTNETVDMSQAKKSQVSRRETTQPEFACPMLTIEKQICSKLTIKAPERRARRRSGAFIFNFKHISHLVLVFLLLTLNM